MAGGKSSRFDFSNILDESFKFHEKPLLKLEPKGKYFIDFIIDAVAKSKKINNIIIATSTHTKNTKEYLENLNLNAVSANISIFETPGDGYLSDLHLLVKFAKPETVIAISADIPLISTEIIDESITSYFEQGKPSLTVLAKIDSYLKIGLKPTEIFEVDGINHKLVPVGINLIDCDYIDEPVIDQSIYFIHENEVIFNINTVGDYKILQNKFKK